MSCVYGNGNGGHKAIGLYMQIRQLLDSIPAEQRAILYEYYSVHKRAELLRLIRSDLDKGIFKKRAIPLLEWLKANVITD